jgi:hypothetical protein
MHETLFVWLVLPNANDVVTDALRRAAETSALICQTETSAITLHRT